MPATVDNSIARAQAAIAAGEGDTERLTVLLNEINEGHTEVEALNEQRDALKAKAEEANKRLEAKYTELTATLPPNPLGNQNIGAV